MGSCIGKEYEPEGIWTEDRFILKYTCKDNRNNIEDIRKQLNECSLWLKQKLAVMERINGYQELSNGELVILEKNFLSKITYLVGEKNHDLYMEIQTDFRNVYGIKPFKWSGRDNALIIS